jgi:hypothetical protein
MQSEDLHISDLELGSDHSIQLYLHQIKRGWFPFTDLPAADHKAVYLEAHFNRSLTMRTDDANCLVLSQFLCTRL